MPIIEGLTNANYRVWYDEGIEAGSEWPENVASHITKSEVVLILLSNHALDSQNCIREIHFSIKKRKKILVVYLEELELSDGMDMQLSPLQAMFLYKFKTLNAFIEKLCAANILLPCNVNGKAEKKAIVSQPKKTTPKKTAKPPEVKPPKKAVQIEEEPAPLSIKLTNKDAGKKYNRVPWEYFHCNEIAPTLDETEVEKTKQNILSTLEEFRITDVEIVSVDYGPTTTRYNLWLPRNFSPRKIMALDQNLAIALRCYGLFIYPNFEEGVLCIEVPNKNRTLVPLGCMLKEECYLNAPSSTLTFPIGKDVTNKKVYGDIGKMVHLLISGSSGSGKSVFLHSLITSLIYKYSPGELRLVLIDPKKTEFQIYEGLPHLLIDEIIQDPGKAIQALKWAIAEMDRRYALLEQMSRTGEYVVNINQYNEHVEEEYRLPKIVIIIDELADLMLFAKQKTQDYIQTLTQKARAAGIHLISTTQRPSTDVITGTIKANMPTRIAFTVSTEVDSRVILDQSGAQNLLGKGDLLYTAPGMNTAVRLQSPYISYQNVMAVVSFIKQNYKDANHPTEQTTPIDLDNVSIEEPKPKTIDELHVEALRFVVKTNTASISAIQRKLNVGYNRAGKIIEWMEDMGYISPFDGAKARKVLITKEQFEALYGPLEK
jgi:S-DNA-T family DNA segregation ATPase FtsK/SpoIIIE